MDGARERSGRLLGFPSGFSRSLLGFPVCTQSRDSGHVEIRLGVFFAFCKLCAVSEALTDGVFY